MKAYIPAEPFRGKKTYSKVALLDRYEQQVQGIGRTKKDALEEAKEYGIEDLPETAEAVDEEDRLGIDPRFSFILVTEAQAKELEKNPAWEYGALACYAPTALGI